MRDNDVLSGMRGGCEVKGLGIEDGWGWVVVGDKRRDRNKDVLMVQMVAVIRGWSE